MVAYCYAVDDLSDVGPLLDLFTEDAVLDFSDIGLPVMEGREAFSGFYERVFADMSDHTHYLSNFRLESYDSQRAIGWAYVEGLGRAKDGNEVHVHVRYKMELEKAGELWKIAKYWIFQGMPPPSSLSEIHAEH